MASIVNINVLCVWCNNTILIIMCIINVNNNNECEDNDNVCGQ